VLSPLHLITLDGSNPFRGTISRPQGGLVLQAHGLPAVQLGHQIPSHPTAAHCRHRTVRETSLDPAVSHSPPLPRTPLLSRSSAAANSDSGFGWGEGGRGDVAPNFYPVVIGV
jgi:hypothetical protein